MSAPRRGRSIRAAAILAPILCLAGGRAAAQICATSFRIASAIGPAGATVLGAWDFDRDGRPDLLLRTNGEIRVARSAGGSFLLGTPLSTGSVAVGDFDGDGILDVVSVQADGPASAVAFLKGDGLSGFRAVSSLSTTSSLTGPVAADFDGDGRLDLAAHTGGADVFLFRGDGHGGFSAPYVLRTSASAVARLQTLDVDADGRSDLLVSGFDGFASNVVSAYALAPSGYFVETSGPDAGGNQCPFDLAIGDVDGDGRSDVVAVDRYVGGCVDEIRTLLVRTGSSLRSRQLASSLWSPVLADFDGDGRTDLAAVRGSLYGVPTGLSLQRGDGSGGFGPEAVFHLPEGVNRETAVLTAADLDGDGRPDLVLSGIPAVSPLVFRNVCGNLHEKASPGPPAPVRPRTRP